MIKRAAFFTIFMLLLGGCSPQQEELASLPKGISKARYKATMKPYTIKGTTYHPVRVKVGDTMEGISSWYGPNFHGKYTSSGEVYNMYGKTAAHKTWPMNTIVLVENLENGKSVLVRINDRGPFIDGRVLDCSFTAGKKIGLDKSGIAKVKLTVVGFAGKIPKVKLANSMKNSPQSTTSTGFGVQVGAFKDKKSAQKLKKKYGSLGKNVIIKKFNEKDDWFRVWVTGFTSESEAESFMKKNNIQGTIIVGA
jgi:rare lipoprotein A